MLKTVTVLHVKIIAYLPLGERSVDCKIWESPGAVSHENFDGAQTGISDLMTSREWEKFQVTHSRVSSTT